MTPPRPAVAASERMDTVPTLAFPVIRGVQAQREYYVAMWSLRMMKQVSKLGPKGLMRTGISNLFRR